MSRSWWLKTIFQFFLVLASLVILTPTFVEMVLYPEVVTDDSNENNPALLDASGNAVRNPPLPAWYEQYVPDKLKNKKLSLGLDLQGGLMLNYSVDIDSAIDEKLASNAVSLQSNIIKSLGKPVQYRVDPSADRILFTFESDSDAASLNSEYLREVNSPLSFISRQGTVVSVGMSIQDVQDNREASLKQAVEIIRERIDGLGVAQPSVRVENGKQIVVELPGLSKSGVEQAERLISTTAMLTFKLIAPREEALSVFTELSKKIGSNPDIRISGGTLRADDKIDPQTGRVSISGKDILKEFVKENIELIPNGRQIAYEKLDAQTLRQEADDGVDIKKLPNSWHLRLVRTDVKEITGDQVVAAYPASNPDTNIPYVSLKLNKPGGDNFYEITKKFTKHQLAILMDDTLISDPVIRGEIPGGNVSIEMGHGNRQQILEDVNNLVVSLRSGSLPAPIRQESKTLVGPSLGHDSIQSGFQSLVAGFILVIACMIFIYKGSGITASLALLFNILFILAGMASMGAVLTLPGIAGIVLTIGMAVDSNVIVYERIREELRVGELPRKAIMVGFDKALWTILDSNITTAIAAVVLMNFGSGPVKGFAVTLLLGIIATVYTAFYVTKNFFELRSHYNHESLSI